VIDWLEFRLDGFSKGPKHLGGQALLSEPARPVQIILVRVRLCHKKRVPKILRKKNPATDVPKKFGSFHNWNVVNFAQTSPGESAIRCRSRGLMPKDAEHQGLLPTVAVNSEPLDVLLFDRTTESLEQENRWLKERLARFPRAKLPNGFQPARLALSEPPSKSAPQKN
jgi:hypothetical protein